MKRFFLTTVGFLVSSLSAMAVTTMTYDVVDGVKLQLDYYPAENSTSKSSPAFVYFHGGCYSMGSRKDLAADLRSLTKEGVSVFAVDYRLSTVAKYPAAVFDVQQSIRFLRKNAQRLNINPNKIIAHGESAGGYLAAIVGVRSLPDRSGKMDQYSAPVDFVSDWYGRVDFTATQTSGTDCAESFLGLKRSAATMKKFEEASVTATISTKETQFLIIHGTADNQVYPLHSTKLANSLWRKDLKAKLYFYEDQGHGFSRQHPWLITKAAILNFLGKSHQTPLPPLKKLQVKLEERSTLFSGFEVFLKMNSGVMTPLLLDGNHHDFEPSSRELVLNTRVLTKKATPMVVVKFQDASERDNITINSSVTNINQR